jgi:hypothetical protein
MVTKPGDTPGGQERRSHTHPMRDCRGQLPQSRCQPLPALPRKAQADGLIRLSGRIPQGGDAQSIILSPGQRPSPVDPGKAGCPSCPSGRHGWSPCHTERPRPEPLNPHPHAHGPPRPLTAEHDLLPGGPHPGRPAGAGCAGRAPARSLTRPPARRTGAAIRGREQAQAHPKPGNHDPRAPQPNRLPSPADTGKAVLCAAASGKSVTFCDSLPGSDTSARPREASSLP